MSAVAVAYNTIEENRTHPVPRGAVVDDAGRLLTRSTLISIGLHLSLVVIALAINYWPRSEVVGTPVEEVLDVTIIPLSALETMLPQGAPVPPQPVITEPEAAKSEPKKLEAPEPKAAPAKKIVSSKTLSPSVASMTTVSERNRAQDSNTQTSVANSAQQFGVANGDAISLEQARISYQDMVATLLARAKRYPERALKRRMTGEGSIRLEITPDGSLAAFQIIRSTETPILDEELRAMVERAAPFPAFPSDLRKNKLALVVPIAFRIES